MHNFIKYTKCKEKNIKQIILSIALSEKPFAWEWLKGLKGKPSVSSGELCKRASFGTVVSISFFQHLTIVSGSQVEGKFPLHHALMRMQHGVIRRNTSVFM